MSQAHPEKEEKYSAPHSTGCGVAGCDNHQPHHHLGPDQVSERLAWADRYCHDKGLRKTRARDALLAVLAGSGPANWRTLSDTQPLSDLCNPSTVFRLLMKLEEIGLVRRITVREKPPFFTMGMPGEQHNDYVVCTECASVQNLQITCPGSLLERQLEEQFGFKQLHHEFAFYGVCRECSEKAKSRE